MLNLPNVVCLGLLCIYVFVQFSFSRDERCSEIRSLEAQWLEPMPIASLTYFLCLAIFFKTL